MAVIIHRYQTEVCFCNFRDILSRPTDVLLHKPHQDGNAFLIEMIVVTGRSIHQQKVCIHASKRISVFACSECFLRKAAFLVGKSENHLIPLIVGILADQQLGIFYRFAGIAAAALRHNQQI